MTDIVGKVEAGAGWLAIGAVTLALQVTSVARLHRLVHQTLGRLRAPGSPDASRARRVGAAVDAASRRWTRATCLRRALATDLLLRMIGQPPELKIGFGTADGGLAGHAWIVSGDVVLRCGSPVEAYPAVVGAHA